MQRLLIITGGSKGIGAGIVKAYLSNGFNVISFSRTKNQSENFKVVKQIIVDLSSAHVIENLLIDTLKAIEISSLSAITLINNAGKLGQITTFDQKSVTDINETIFLNTTVPLMLTAQFLNLTKKLTCRKKIINISSGAAKNPYFGWVVYCASKSAIDMMTKAVALEQDTFKNGAKIIAIYPGVVDTDMQAQIRESDKADFRDLDKFIDYKNSGLLSNIDHVGQEIFKIDYDEQTENGAIIRVPDQR